MECPSNPNPDDCRVRRDRDSRQRLLLAAVRPVLAIPAKAAGDPLSRFLALAALLRQPWRTRRKTTLLKQRNEGGTSPHGPPLDVIHEKFAPVRFEFRQVRVDGMDLDPVQESEAH